MRLIVAVLCATLSGCGAVNHYHHTRLSQDADPRVPDWVTTSHGNIVLQRGVDKLPCYYPIPARGPSPQDTLAWVHLYTYLVKACQAGQLGQSQQAANPEDAP